MAAQRTSSRQSNNRKIGPADIERLRRGASDALAYYADTGLAEVRSRAINIALAGLIPLGGLMFFQWSPATMIFFMMADAAGTVLADILKYIIARPMIAAHHERDHVSGQMLLIADGLEDGSGTMADQGKHAPAPGTILFFGIVCTLFLGPVAAAMAEPIGGAPFRALIQERFFLLTVGLDFAWRVGGGLVEAVRARLGGDERQSPVFIESGGVAVLYATLLVLVWLPISLGKTGLYLLFFILFIGRLSFGLFALIWTPKAVRNLERRHREGDYSLKPKK